MLPVENATIYDIVLFIQNREGDREQCTIKGYIDLLIILLIIAAYAFYLMSIMIIYIVVVCGK